jgi:hypothetical protein
VADSIEIKTILHKQAKTGSGESTAPQALAINGEPCPPATAMRPIHITLALTPLGKIFGAPSPSLPPLVMFEELFASIWPDQLQAQDQSAKIPLIQARVPKTFTHKIMTLPLQL